MIIASDQQGSDRPLEGSPSLIAGHSWLLTLIKGDSMRNKSMLVWLGVGLTLSGFVFPIQVLGQVGIGTSRIYGNISDPSGAAVPGATVRITEHTTLPVHTLAPASDAVY